jgi:Fe-S cluster biogenesis protein NfuA
LLGACVRCPSSSITLKMGIEQNLRKAVPEVVSVEQV